MTASPRVPIRVLMVEDSENDAELVSCQLQRGGYEPHLVRVETAAALKSALLKGGWDLVLSDYALPAFGGPQAQQIVKDTGLDLPFILVSGSIGEQAAVAAMKAGAHDYVLKQNLERLAPAVSRELREAEVRRRRRRAEASIHFLAEASTALGESLDVSVTVGRVGALTVPFLADWCVVDLCDAEGRLERVVAAHREPAQVERLRELPGGAVGGLDRGLPTAIALQTGRVAVLDLQGDAGLALDPAVRGLLEGLGTRELFAAPLIARDRVVGVMSYGSRSGLDADTAEDLRLAEELARRSAIAIDNAHLYAQAQEAIRLRDEFLTVASHELKTPLTTLDLQISTLERSAAKIAADAATLALLRDRLALVGRQSWRLKRLINELLDVTSIIGNQMDLELSPVDLSAVVRQVAAELSERGELSRTGSSLRLDLPPALVGRWDRQRARHLVLNLMSNALKYGDGNPVEVRLGVEGGKARLIVADHGIGIAADEQERIFGKFERAVSVRHYGGLGLGLFLVRSAVTALGGTISLRSEPGSGSTFTVTLPVEGPAASAEGEAPLHA